MRSPRRTFAAPFVLTLVGADGASGFTSCNPPRQTEPTVSTNPPDPGPGSAGSDGGSGSAVVIAGQPDGGYTTDHKPRPGEARWTVFKQGKDCFASADTDCPPATAGVAVSCNPPPPMAYACPTDLAMDRPLAIARYADDTTCHVVPAPMTCPAGAICNPPPLQQVACPTP